MHKADATSHVNNRFLSLEERQEKLEKQHASIRSLQKKVQHLKSKIQKLTDKLDFTLVKKPPLIYLSLWKEKQQMFKYCILRDHFQGYSGSSNMRQLNIAKLEV